MDGWNTSFLLGWPIFFLGDMFCIRDSGGYNYKPNVTNGRALLLIDENPALNWSSSRLTYFFGIVLACCGMQLKGKEAAVRSPLLPNVDASQEQGLLHVMSSVNSRIHGHPRYLLRFRFFRYILGSPVIPNLSKCFDVYRKEEIQNIPTGELTYLTLGKGKSSPKVPWDGIC